MQDYNYVYASCMEITLELSCCKYPMRNQLPKYWKDNKNALISYLNEAHRGIRGIVTNSNGVAISGATLRIKNREIPFKSTSRGEFWRILLPGRYVLQVDADGYQHFEKPFDVHDGQISYVNIQLEPLSSQVSAISSYYAQCVHVLANSILVVKVMHVLKMTQPSSVYSQIIQLTTLSSNSIPRFNSTELQVEALTSNHACMNIPNFVCFLFICFATRLGNL